MALSVHILCVRTAYSETAHKRSLELAYTDHIYAKFHFQTFVSAVKSA